MTKKSKKHQSNGGLVYSTDAETMASLFKNILTDPEIIPPQQQLIHVKLDTKMLAGKKATIVSGFEGSMEAVEELLKKIKTRCGTGGSLKDGLLIIQGDFVQQVKNMLAEAGYQVK